MDRVARRGPLARAPGALKGGHFRNCQHFVAAEGVLSQNIKQLKGEKFLFSEKNLKVPKKTVRGDPLGFSNIHSVAKQQKIEGGTLWGKIFGKKVSQCRKKLERGLFGLAVYSMLRGKTGKTFLVQFARPNSAIWCNNIL